jgi:ribosome-binding protein aMBF1 (putative translation factor)
LFVLRTNGWRVCDKTVGTNVKNLIRQQVVLFRQRHGWSQEKFAAKLQLAGWHNATRSTVS